ncbi:MAG: helix-turn-helix transcriptional regulator [Candidatus Bathyarchaeia archaeon]|jgi:DNA-binding PadR family transcriptional regulator
MNPETQDETTQSWLKEAQKGYIRMGVLILLNKKPGHGYELMKEINSRTKGFWQPTPGGVYPILNDLEKSNYIKGQWQTQKNRRLKVYKITLQGQTILKHAIVKQAEIFNTISSLFSEFAREVLQIETTLPAPNMPTPFAPFLEDKKACAENLPELEAHRKHLKENIKNLRQRLVETDQKIAELKKQAPKDTPEPQPPT